MSLSWHLKSFRNAKFAKPSTASKAFPLQYKITKHSVISLISFCLFFFFGICPRSNAHPETWADSLVQSIEKNALSQAEQNQALICRLEDSARLHPQDTRLETYVLYARVANLYPQGKPDTLLNRELQQKRASLPEKAVFEKALLNLALAMEHTSGSLYTNAFQEGLKALELFRQNGNSHFEAKTLLLLGNICINIKSYSMASIYLNQCVALTESRNFEHYQALLALSKNQFYVKGADSALQSLLSLIPNLEQYQNTGLLTIGYMNLTTFYFTKMSLDSALFYGKKALALSAKLDNNRIKSILYQNIAGYFFVKGDTDQAFRFVSLAEDIAIQDHNIEQLSYALYNLGLIYQQTGQTDSALFYMMRYIDISNEIARHSGAIDAYQAYVSVLLENSENRLTIAQQDIQLKNRRLGFLALFTTLIIITAALVFTLFWHKKRQQSLRNDLEKKELETKLANEKHLKQLQARQHQEILEAKAREIASYSLLVSNKNQILQQIADIAKRIPGSLPEASEIQNIIRNNINTDKDWEDFMLHFQKIHPCFFQRLKELPCTNELTENELRLCAYFRIGMSNKQIAQILNVSPESVRMHRYRLKKKFALKEEENLDDFIRNL